jgi:YVTN family beta-propeller protein
VQIGDKIHLTLVFLMIIQITLLALLDTLLSNNAFAQETLHDRRLSEVVTQTRRSQEGPQIDVGDYPTKIAVNEDTNKAYVANYDSGTVSVIDGDSDTKIGEDIPVGGSPVDIAVNEDTEIAYVANEGSDSVSVIDYTANELVAGIKFHVNPFNSGYIQCDDTANFSLDDLTAASPTEQLVYVRSGTGCTAKPNEGFEFVSWEENLEGNSTQPISVSRPSSSLDSFLEFLHLKSADKPEATLNITKFGTFTANFKELPPEIPHDYQLIVVSAIVGSIVTSIAAAFGRGLKRWIRSKRKLRKYKQHS